MTSTGSIIEQQSAMFDTFTLHGSPGTVSVRAVFTVDGTVIVDPGAFEIGFASASAAIGLFTEGGNVINSGLAWESDVESWCVADSCGRTAINQSFQFNIYRDLTMAIGTSFDLGFVLRGSARFGTVDASHTGVISFILPTGVTITSQDGFVNPSSSVPEPASVLLIGTGLAALLVLQRHATMAVAVAKR